MKPPWPHMLASCCAAAVEVTAAIKATMKAAIILRTILLFELFVPKQSIKCSDLMQ